MENFSHDKYNRCMYLLVVKQLVIMMMIVIGGFIFARAFKVSEKEQKFLSKLLLYFINPCLVVSSFNKEFNREKLIQLGIVFIISVIIHFVMIAIAVIFIRKKNTQDNSIDVLDRVGVVFTNCGFIGIPLIRGVFGEEGVFLLMGFLVTFNLFLWTYGYYQMCGSINLKKIITNPNIIGVCLGLLIFCMPFTLPEMIGKPLSMIGDLNTALSMILLGVLFSSFKKPENSKIVYRVVRFCVLRLVVIAVFVIAILTLINYFLAPIYPCKMLLFVILICSMCPAATSVPSLACVFDKDTSYASLIVSATSLFCIITVPTFVAIAEKFIK